MHYSTVSPKMAELHCSVTLPGPVNPAVCPLPQGQNTICTSAYHVSTTFSASFHLWTTVIDFYETEALNIHLAFSLVPFSIWPAVNTWLPRSWWLRSWQGGSPVRRQSNQPWHHIKSPMTQVELCIFGHIKTTESTLHVTLCAWLPMWSLLITFSLAPIK